jgi:uncharacterized protein (DUF2236 family)
VDGYYREQLQVARLVGLDPATVPGSAADVAAYYEEIRPRLVGTLDAKTTARYLSVPNFPYKLGWTPVRPLWIGVSAYAFSLLPAWARRLYGLPGLAATDLTATLTARGLRTAIRLLPSNPFEGPLYRAAMARAALARAASTTRKAGARKRISTTRTPGTAKAAR